MAATSINPMALSSRANAMITKRDTRHRQPFESIPWLLGARDGTKSCHDGIMNHSEGVLVSGSVPKRLPRLLSSRKVFPVGPSSPAHASHSTAKFKIAMSRRVMPPLPQIMDSRTKSKGRNRKIYVWDTIFICFWYATSQPANQSIDRRCCWE